MIMHGVTLHSAGLFHAFMKPGVVWHNSSLRYHMLFDRTLRSLRMSEAHGRFDYNRDDNRRDVTRFGFIVSHLPRVFRADRIVLKLT